VEDLPRSVAFYRDGLRFATDADAPSSEAAVALRAGDLRLILSQAEAGTNGCRGSGVALTVEVSGVEAYYDALVARGLKPSVPRDEEGRRAFSVADPDGYVWRFVQSLT
jgi:catechol 2,3-dioxygenase-like lactoylglutathione lyase family enzyme